MLFLRAAGVVEGPAVHLVAALHGIDGEAVLAENIERAALLFAGVKL